MNATNAICDVNDFFNHHNLDSPAVKNELLVFRVADRYKEVDFKGHAGHKLWKVNYIAFLDDTERGKQDILQSMTMQTMACIHGTAC